jgi:hypothetical protein
MAFGVDDLQYGTGLGNQEDQFGIGGTAIYDEYMGDAYVSDEVDVEDYLYKYDPLKEQNLLADYMSGLVDMGDKTEAIRDKAIAERKALSKSIGGGLTTGTMVEMEEEGMEAASKAQAGLYRGQASAKRQLGEQIGSLREAYESDIAQGVLDYNEAVGSDELGTIGGEAELIQEGYGDVELAKYIRRWNLEDSGPHGTDEHGYGTGPPGTNNQWGSNGDTWYKKQPSDWGGGTGQNYVYFDKGWWYDGHWKKGTEGA